jgi:hypothetical protein
MRGPSPDLYCPTCDTFDSVSHAQCQEGDERKIAFALLIQRLEDTLGIDVARHFFWSCTPMPFGLPSDAQLAEGQKLLTGELTIHELLAKVEKEMYEAYKAYKATRQRLGVATDVAVASVE